MNEGDAGGNPAGDANELNEYMEMEIDVYLKFMADELSDSYAASQKKKMLEKVTNYRTLKSKCTGE